MGRMVEFQSEGRPVRGYLAQSRMETAPGILVLHAWWGLNEFSQKVCNRLRRQGYTAFAPDLYGGQTAGTIEEARQLIEAMDFLEARSIVINSVQLLKGYTPLSPFAAIGFSMGAAWSIFLSCLQPEDFKAVVVFYGSEAADYSRSKSDYLGHFAEEDEWEPLDGVRQMETSMQTAGCHTEFHIYPAVRHWFVEEDRPEYYPKAARLAWRRTLDFLDRRFKAYTCP